MTPYEYLDLAQSGQANSISLLGFGFTIVCGYLLVAYTVGLKLTTLQVVAITFIYTTTIFFNLGAQLSNLTEANEFKKLADEMLVEQTFRSYPNAVLIIMFIRCSIYFVSLWFMWDVRHPKTE